jgi:hypothetical protein
MSNFVVNLNELPKRNAANGVADSALFENQVVPKKSSRFLKALKIIGTLLILFLLVGAIGGYFYWRNLKTTPQYSMALLVDAARSGDQAAVDELVDTNAVVDDFMPQITDKAIELYGRGLAPATIQKVAQAAAPLMPVVKQRARLEVPNLIREKTKSFEKIPFWVIAVGAERYVEIIREGDKSFVRSRQAERPFEVVMKKNGERWQVVGIKDEALARVVAERIGQDLIAGAKNGNIKKAGEQLGVSNLDLEEVLKKADDIFK